MKNKNLNINLDGSGKSNMRSRDKQKVTFAILNSILLIAVIAFIYYFACWVGKIFAGNATIDPIAFRLSDARVHWYGVCFIIGFLVALKYIILMGRAKKQSMDNITNLVFFGAIFGMLGARLVFVALNYGYYLKHPLETLNIWEGGLSLYGALLFGLLTIIVYCKARKINVWTILDIFAPAMLLGQVIGRWGNFFNQELFGYPTNSFLKMYVTPYNRPWDFRTSSFFHPVFLYESILSLIAFTLLVYLATKKKMRPGMIFALYLISYSIIRFAIEFVRIEPKIYLGLTLGQLTSLGVLAVTSIVLMALTPRKNK